MRSMERDAGVINASLGIVALFIGVILVLTTVRVASYFKPTPESIVKAFEEEGLEVGDYYAIEQEQDWDESPARKTYEKGVRFEIPSLREDAGGRVFVFDEREDLGAMVAYYEGIEESSTFGSELESHLYTEQYPSGYVLLQINGKLSKDKADRYGEVMENVT